MTNKVKRGDLYLADLSFAVGSEQTGVRPVLIIQNNKGNKYSPTTIIVCLSSKIHSKAKIPTHYLLPELNGLKYPSMVLCEQIKVIDKDRLIKKIGKSTNVICITLIPKSASAWSSKARKENTDVQSPILHNRLIN